MSSVHTGNCRASILVGFLLMTLINRISVSSFTLKNSCNYTVWPGISGNSGTLSTTGFELSPGQESITLSAPAGWNGRLWGRTVCTFDSKGKGTCATGDCGGSLKCNGMQGQPPATLAEFTIDEFEGKDFYDVSLVDGFNLPIIVTPKGSNGTCSTAGCISDINLSCPRELQVHDGGRGRVVACKNACLAFGNGSSPEYCNKPSSYSKLFKTACPTSSYSYSLDDPGNTFVCTGADYIITFCPTIDGLKMPKESPGAVIGNNTEWSVNTTASDNQAVSSLTAPLFVRVSIGIMISLSLLHAEWHLLFVQSF
eukprot:Gb_14848 [translate_table: standard]